MVSKHQREHERRRYEKWQERQAAARSRRNRQRIVAGAIVAALVLAVGITAAVTLSSDSSDASSPLPAESSTPQPSASSTALPARTGNGGTLPKASLAENRTWTGTLSLSQGDIGISLDGKAAPQAVANFVTLAGEGYFDSTPCHRLTTSGIYVLQCGDPTGTGTGGPGYTWGPIENAPSDDEYPAGTIAMARAGDDGSSMGSQFFLVYKDSKIPSDSAGGYTVFGRITSGLDVVKTIADAGTGPDGVAPASPVTIEGVETK